MEEVIWQMKVFPAIPIPKSILGRYVIEHENTTVAGPYRELLKRMY